MTLKTKLLRGLFELDHAINNVATGQDEASEDQGEEEGDGVLIFLRQGGGGGIWCLLLLLINITQQLSQT